MMNAARGVTSAGACRLLQARRAGVERELTGGPVERVDRPVSEQLTADAGQGAPLRHVLERDVARGQPPVAVGHEHRPADAGAEIVTPAVPEAGVEDGDRAGGPAGGGPRGPRPRGGW